MARYALYGSIDELGIQSYKSTASNAFNINNQTAAFPNVKTPLKSSEIDKGNKTTVPSNVYMDYTLNGTSITTVRNNLAKTLNLYEEGAQSTFTKYTEYYNRFKLPTLNDAFQKGFAHVFFTRPDCNLVNGTATKLNDSFKNDPEFSYAWKNNPALVKQLVIENGQKHDFMLALSNKAAGFSTNDEFINTDTYGKSYKGWQIAYGKNNIESKSAGDFNVTFNDDRTLHIYQLHKLWVDYISDVYQGKKSPKTPYILTKILDYASSCYYIITAEDGETIIFWSKYYGVFPTTIPSNQFSWAQGNIIEKPQIDIKYQYSFKEDMNPEALIEFNINAGVQGNASMTYVPVYDPKLGHAGTTWVGAPYIELVNNNTDPECPYTFKLRFSEPKST